MTGREWWDEFFAEPWAMIQRGAVEQVLKPGARFLVEGHVAETLLPIYRERDWYWAGSAKGSPRVLEERFWDIQTGRIKGTCTTVDEHATRTSVTSIRIYGFRELRALLESAGFVNVEARDGKTGGALRVGSPRALIVAEKRAR